MTEQPPSSGDIPKLSRRDFLRGAVAGAAIAATAHKLTEGISLNKPSLNIEPFLVHRTDEDIQLFFGPDTDGVITITPEDKLLFEPSGAFFTSDKDFSYVHRGGNSYESIAESYRKGANFFDIDLAVVDNVLYGEHGIVPQAELRFGGRSLHAHLPAVIDVNEMEVKLGMPRRYEELIAYIAKLSTGDSERPLAVSVELKRGKFDLDTLIEILYIHQKYNVPVIMHSPDPQQLRLIGSELTAAYAVQE